MVGVDFVDSGLNYFVIGFGKERGVGNPEFTGKIGFGKRTWGTEWNKEGFLGFD
jgi:hypothetical protein